MATGFFSTNMLAGLSSVVQTFLAASTQAAMRSALGLTDPSVMDQLLTNSAQYTNSTITMSAINGCSFTPQANGIYLVRWFASHTAAATTTGMAMDLSIGNATSSLFEIARGTGSTVQVFFAGPVTGTAYAIGGSTPASPSEAPYMGWAIVTAAASPSADIQLMAASEVGSSQITIPAYKAVMLYRKLN